YDDGEETDLPEDKYRAQGYDPPFDKLRWKDVGRRYAIGPRGHLFATFLGDRFVCSTTLHRYFGPLLRERMASDFVGYEEAEFQEGRTTADRHVIAGQIRPMGEPQTVGSSSAVRIDGLRS